MDTHGASFAWVEFRELDPLRHGLLTHGAPAGQLFISLRRIKWSTEIRAHVTELKTHRLIVLEYSIDAKEFTQAHQAEVSDCEVAGVREGANLERSGTQRNIAEIKAAIRSNTRTLCAFEIACPAAR